MIFKTGKGSKIIFWGIFSRACKKKRYLVLLLAPQNISCGRRSHAFPFKDRRIQTFLISVLDSDSCNNIIRIIKNFLAFHLLINFPKKRVLKEIPSTKRNWAASLAHLTC